MMLVKRFLRAMICMACFSLGCKAVPDGDDLDRLRDQVASIPADVRNTLARWAANRVAFGYVLANKDHNTDHVGTIRCSAKMGPDLNDPVYDVAAFELLHCLDRNIQASYFDCLDKILENRADIHPNRTCIWEAFRPEYDPKTAPKSFEAREITDQEISDALIGPPPPAEIQLLLMGLPGFVGPGGALCPQGVDWACAPNPLDEDPDTTTGAASGGGDR